VHPSSLYAIYHAETPTCLNSRYFAITFALIYYATVKTHLPP